MSQKIGGLGRGLGALLPQNPPPVAAIKTPEPRKVQEERQVDELEQDIVSRISVIEVSPESIVANPHQPRTHFSPSDLEDLIASIKEHGILQPLVVTKKGNDQYELIAGERRLRASRALGLKSIPVIVRSDINEQKKLELALIENIQRQDLNAVEEAKSYEALADLFSLTKAEVADRVGKSRSYVTNLMRLLELDEDMLKALIDQKITKSHARTLLSEGDSMKRKVLFDQMLSGGMTVREAEAKATGLIQTRKAQKEKDPNIAAIEQELRQNLGTKVQIQMRGQGGKMSITFYSKSDLKRIIEKLVD